MSMFSTEDDRKKFMGAIQEISNSMLRIEAERDLIREIVKDMEDMDGDYQSGINSLPIAIGVQKTKIIVGVLTVISIGILAYYVNSNLFELDYVVYYTMILIVGPLIYFGVKLLNATTKKEFHHLSLVLKIILFFGILSVAVIVFNLKLANA